MQGYFLPLSGGIDSCATAVIVYSMFWLVVDVARSGSTSDQFVIVGTDGGCADGQVIADARWIAGDPVGSAYVSTDPRELRGRILHTWYMGTDNSSADTRRCARELAEAIGRSARLLFSFLLNRDARRSYHMDLNMEHVVTALRTLFYVVTGL